MRIVRILGTLELRGRSCSRCGCRPRCAATEWRPRCWPVTRLRRGWSWPPATACPRTPTGCGTARCWPACSGRARRAVGMRPRSRSAARSSLGIRLRRERTPAREGGSGGSLRRGWPALAGPGAGWAAGACLRRAVRRARASEIIAHPASATKRRMATSLSAADTPGSGTSWAMPQAMNASAAISRIRACRLLGGWARLTAVIALATRSGGAADAPEW